MHHIDTVQPILAFVADHRNWGYVFLFFTMIFEGELILIIAGILSQMKAFNLFEAFFVAFLGVLAGDIFWYWVGHFLKKRYPNNKLILEIEKRVTKVLPGIVRNPFHVVFISKFIYGFNHSSIMILGFLKSEFWHFFRIQFFTSFLWCAIFITLGYFFGFAALSYSHKFNKVAILIIMFVVSVLIVERIIRWLFEEKKIKI